MSGPDLVHLGVAFASAFIAGAINAVAGGGTLVTFPSLIWLGLPSVIANATSTVAIWPGSLGAMFGFRRDLRSIEPRMYSLLIPSLVGGIAGAVLLQWTPSKFFDKLVPFLILFATLLFAVQGYAQSRLKREKPRGRRSGRWFAGALFFQLLVALYGGYFGAGIGILMLAALGILGLTDIHQMNGLKNLFAMSINGAAAVYFVCAHMVQWQYVVIMAVGAVVGGYSCAGIAHRIGGVAVRRIVIVVGLAMAISLFIKR